MHSMCFSQTYNPAQGDSILSLGMKSYRWSYLSYLMVLSFNAGEGGSVSSFKSTLENCTSA